MKKQRLDQVLVARGVMTTRSQAENYIKLGQVTVNKTTVTKTGFLVTIDDVVAFEAQEQYVSRAGLKLASVAQELKLDFENKVVLDVGSSTGGFTDYALQHGAQRVIAVDIGTNQLHPILRQDKRIELHEKTDIRTFVTEKSTDIATVDLSFISLRQILPQLAEIISKNTKIVAMVKPQFEANRSLSKQRGVIKNDHIRRDILKDFESWARHYFVILSKADSQVRGSKGNQERFYLLRKV